jgi:hypothetical protein
MCGGAFPSMFRFDEGYSPTANPAPSPLSDDDKREWDKLEARRVALLEKSEAIQPMWRLYKRKLPSHWSHSGGLI